MKRFRSRHIARALAVAVFMLAAFTPYASPALAENKPGPAFEAFVRAFSEVSDYKDIVSAHETSDDGKDVQDRVYSYKWKRPTMAQIDVMEGPGKGGGAVWNGGDKVKGHQGGILSGLKLTVDIHDRRAVSLRGDTIEVASFDYLMKHFQTTAGTLSEAGGPAIDGIPTTTVTLIVTDPKTNGNVTKEVLYLGNAKHLPVRRDAFVGAQLVKSETFKDIKTNTGMKAEDFNA